eukprot:TRINITY_DN4348_c0_g2_i1.p1 TRINITY_DN4348_c0_g2~~TRINITY_DN4348_c0_g2_i1.p1  ORF type:complete len:264 (-),score=18.04 TRINITY_DN4348_c0_g2_i1:52-843(-)
MFLRALPFLALLAAMSCEASAEVYNSYSSLKAYTNPEVPTYSIVRGKTGEVIATPETLCTFAAIDGGTCDLTSATWDEADAVEVGPLNLPSADAVAPGVGAPSKVVVKLCYAKPDTINRKWRKFNDLFKKDKTCLQKTDPIDFAVAENAKLVLKSTTPKAAFTVSVFVKCADQGDNEYCYLKHPFPSYSNATNAVYFPAQTMDARPTNLYVAVFICVAIGPILLLAFLIYERGVLAKQAQAQVVIGCRIAAYRHILLHAFYCC